MTDKSETDQNEPSDTPLTPEEWREVCTYLEQEKFVPISEARAFGRHYKADAPNG